MYKDFFDLKECPFNITSDPHFLYLTNKHKEALSLLQYGVQQRKGFIEVTGDIGTGKTTLCRALINSLDSKTKTSYIFNPKLPVIQFIRAIIEDFGIEIRKKSKMDMIKALNRFLLEQLSCGNNAVLIIDEAQNLDNRVIEEVRLLSNLETEQEKLLQIILIGQPELKEKLRSPDLAQLKQRITIRYHLTPLNKDEIRYYIDHRLKIAGNKGQVTFTENSIEEIFSFSKGIPRLTNVVCDRALLMGYTKETRTIDADIIRKSASEINGDLDYEHN
ncbi:MAG: XrtA/PEP-CTERM system-associated ATPase [Candidatus Omnitrophota bacterium]